MNPTNPLAAAESRRATAYGAIEALELNEARARRAFEQDPTPENEAAAAEARRALQAGWLEADRAEISHGQAAAAGAAAEGWALALSFAQLAQAVVTAWDAANPRRGDYRASDAEEGLRLAIKALGHLSRGEQYPEWRAARAKFLKSLGDAAA